MNDSAVIVNYELPMPPDDSSEDKISVLPFIQHGRPCRSIANPEIESLFELSLIPASPYGRQGCADY